MPDAKEHADDEREMKAFVAGWFAHARNPKDAPFLVEDAWHAYRLLAGADHPDYRNEWRP